MHHYLSLDFIIMVPRLLLFPFEIDNLWPLIGTNHVKSFADRYVHRYLD